MSFENKPLQGMDPTVQGSISQLSLELFLKSFLELFLKLSLKLCKDLLCLINKDRQSEIPTLCLLELLLEQKQSCSKQSYQHYNEIQTCPHACKVFVQAKSYPFKKHFHCEQNCEHEIDNLQNEFELLIVLKVDIFEAERKAGNVNILILNKHEF